MIVILFRTVIIFALLTLGLRLTGKRQIGELELSELITTLLLSELAAAPIADPDIPLAHAIIPIFFISSLEVVLTYFSSRNVKIKRVLDGAPSVVVRDGVIDQKELARIRMSGEELLAQLRRQSIGDPRDVRLAIFEEDGQLSAFPIENAGNRILHALVVDGHLCEYSLRLSGRDESWVASRLKKRKRTLDNTFLFAVDESGDESYIKKEE